MASDPVQQQNTFYDFMWRSFIALNWPHQEGGERGQPSQTDSILTQAGFGPLVPSVWETYRSPDEIFLPPVQWNDYPSWNTPRPPTAGAPLPAGARPLMGYSDLVEYASDILQPDVFPDPTGLLVDQCGGVVRYEVATNQAFFTYIEHFRYFDCNQQIADVLLRVEDPNNPAGFQQPPFGTKAQFGAGGYLQDLPVWARQGMVDVKAAWRPLDPVRDRLDRYLHRKIDTGERVQLMGLVALHILRFTPNGANRQGRVAATFEQVDNVSLEEAVCPDFEPTSPAPSRPSFNRGTSPSNIQSRLGFEGPIPTTSPTPVDIYRVTPLPTAVQTANCRYRKLLRGSVFEHYQLIGTQNKHPGKTVPQSDPANNGHEGPVTGTYTNTNNLINAALESYTQANYSSILCHVRARPIGVPMKASEVDDFKTLTFLLQSAHGRPIKGVCNCRQCSEEGE
ncbi:MAG: hypothetical protein AAF481_05835 [Acidobacteriota bacterium]